MCDMCDLAAVSSTTKRKAHTICMKSLGRIVPWCGKLFHGTKPKVISWFFQGWPKVYKVN